LSSQQVQNYFWHGKKIKDFQDQRSPLSQIRAEQRNHSHNCRDLPGRKKSKSSAQNARKEAKKLCITLQSTTFSVKGTC